MIDHLRSAEHLVALTLEQGAPERGLDEVIGRVSTLPKLERLGLRRWFAAGQTEKRRIKRLLAYPRLDRLVELDLSRNQLSDELDQLVENAHRFAHIEKLDLRVNGFHTGPRAAPGAPEATPACRCLGPGAAGAQRILTRAPEIPRTFSIGRNDRTIPW